MHGAMAAGRHEMVDSHERMQKKEVKEDALCVGLLVA